MATVGTGGRYDLDFSQAASRIGEALQVEIKYCEGCGRRFYRPVAPAKEGLKYCSTCTPTPAVS